MRPLGIGLAAVVLVGALSAFPSRARADDEMATALADFAAAEKDLALTAPCDSMCKALQSMVRAADRICDLARDGSASDQKRCTDARQKVAEATARVRAACPECNPAPPYAPSTTPPPVTKKGETKADGTGSTSVPGADQSAPPATPLEREEAASYRTAGTSQRTTTIALDVLPLFGPPWLIHARLERRAGARISVSITGGYGSLGMDGPDGPGRAPVITLGGEVRAYVVGGFDGFGVFFAGDFVHRGATLKHAEGISTTSFPLGLTAGAVVGTKLVTAIGFTLEARAGASYVVRDARFEPSARLLPHGGVSLGWTF